jgi:hypothetical protein
MKFSLVLLSALAAVVVAQDMPKGKGKGPPKGGAPGGGAPGGKGGAPGGKGGAGGFKMPW